MSSAPCTLGTMTTSSLSPISVTRVVRSSRTQGLSRALTRVHSWVGPKSVSRAMSTRPCRAASLLSALIASSRLPSRTSGPPFPGPTIWGTFAAILALDGSKKWIARLGRAGISRSGSGAPTARGREKALAERMRGAYRRRPPPGYDALHSTPARGLAGGALGVGGGVGVDLGRDVLVADIGGVVVPSRLVDAWIDLRGPEHQRQRDRHEQVEGERRGGDVDLGVGAGEGGQRPAEVGLRR